MAVTPNPTKELADLLMAISEDQLLLNNMSGWKRHPAGRSEGEDDLPRCRADLCSAWRYHPCRIRSNLDAGDEVRRACSAGPIVVVKTQTPIRLASAL